MKAPDKIYLTKGDPHDSIDFDTDVKYGSVMWEQFRLTDYDVEYIRKDFLLRWAKNELENARITDFDDFGRGEVITWEEIVDKLNSL